MSESPVQVLRKSAAPFGALFHHLPIGAALVDADGRLVEGSPALSRVLGRAAEELAGRSLAELVDPEDAGVHAALFAELVRGEREHYRVVAHHVRGDGGLVRGRWTVARLRGDAGGPALALGVLEEGAERAEAEGGRVAYAEALEREHALFERLFESSPAAVVLVDPGDRVLRINPEFTRLFGYAEPETLGRTVGELIAPEWLQEEALALTWQAIEGERIERETVRRRKDGSTLHVSVVGVPVRLHGDRIAAYGVYRDITAQKALEAALEREATTDPLTGMLNRRGFLAALAREWDRAKRAGDAPLLLYADLDGLKRINDRYGHAEGDRALRDAAEVLKRCFRASDAIARLGGDEFVVLATDAEEDSERIIGERIRAALRRLNGAGDRPYRLSMSLGTVRIPAAEAGSPEEVLAEADRRMYEHKGARTPTDPNRDEAPRGHTGNSDAPGVG